MLASVVFLAFFLCQAHSATFTFKNNCPYTVWPATLQNSDSTPLADSTGFELPKGAPPKPVEAPANWAGRFWGRTQCSTDSSGKFSCQTGDCGSGQVACNDAGGAPPTTLAEITLQGSNGQDTYDISLVDGFNVPVSMVPQGGSSGCNTTSCAADINGSCPDELAAKGEDGKTAGCKSACGVFKTDEDCCRGEFGTADKCMPSKYSMIFKAACPQAYSYAYDDKSSTFTCAGATAYDVTFCP